MTSEPTLDPDLEQVLEDIAADPRAKLFITDPRKLLTGLLDGSIETPASRTGLRPAERHLLEVYRHELAWLLRQVYLADLQRRDTSIVYAYESPTLDHLRNQITSLRRSLPTDHTLAPEILSVENTLRTRHIDTSGVLSASLTLELSPQCHIHLANESIEAGEPRTAQRIASHTIMKGGLTSLLQSYCFITLAASQDLLQDRRQSKLCYARAFELTTDLFPNEALLAAANLLRLAALDNDITAAEFASTWIDQHYESDSFAIRNNAKAIQHRQALSSLHCSHSVRQHLLGTLGPSAREIVHAIE